MNARKDREGSSFFVPAYGGRAEDHEVGAIGVADEKTYQRDEPHEKRHWRQRCAQNSLRERRSHAASDEKARRTSFDTEKRG
jgi:hypothetical protein